MGPKCAGEFAPLSFLELRTFGKRSVVAYFFFWMMEVGVGSMLFRQTNFIWIGWVGICAVLRELELQLGKEEGVKDPELGRATLRESDWEEAVLEREC